jgi:hypothetical protein
MRFLGRKWQKKNNGDRNINRISRFALSSFAPAQNNNDVLRIEWERTEQRLGQRQKQRPCGW